MIEAVRIDPKRASAAAPLPQLLARFRVHLEAERRASLHTVRAYMHDAEALCAHLVERGRAPFARSLDVLTVRSFLAALFGKNDAATIARKLSSVRAFLRYLKREGVVQENPAVLL